MRLSDLDLSGSTPIGTGLHAAFGTAALPYILEAREPSLHSTNYSYLVGRHL